MSAYQGALEGEVSIVTFDEKANRAPVGPDACRQPAGKHPAPDMRKAAGSPRAAFVLL